MKKILRLSALILLAPAAIYCNAKITETVKAKQPPSWQSDWSTYVDEIAKEIANGSHPESDGFRRRFAAKNVAWQGIVSKVDAVGKGEYRIRMKMQQRAIQVPISLFPGGLSSGDKGTLTLSPLDLTPLPGTIDDWAQISPGTKVKFTAVTSDFPVLPVAIQGIGGTFIMTAEKAKLIVDKK